MLRFTALLICIKERLALDAVSRLQAPIALLCQLAALRPQLRRDLRVHKSFVFYVSPSCIPPSKPARPYDGCIWSITLKLVSESQKNPIIPLEIAVTLSVTTVSNIEIRCKIAALSNCTGAGIRVRYQYFFSIYGVGNADTSDLCAEDSSRQN